MQKIIVILCLLIIFQSCVNRQVKQTNNQSVMKKEDNSFRKIALLVGVADYRGEEDDLFGIDKDIARMKKIFEREGFQVKILYDGDSLNLLKELSSYSKKLSFMDSFIFYYTGHGCSVKDINGDENDGKDEGIILSNGNINKKLIDDTLHSYFSKIKAKKLIIFDSCYSGTVSKSINYKFKVKSLPSKSITSSFITSKNIFKENLDINNTYIVLSSSEDDEESLSSKRGSLFTKIFSEIFLEYKMESFTSLVDRIRKRILFFCRKENFLPQHPKIEVSNDTLKQKKFNDYFK